MEIPTISPVVLHERLQRERDLVIVDVRHEAELLGGILPSAIHLSLHELRLRATKVLPGPHVPTVVYCAHGVRSAEALRLLQQLGFIRVEHLEGGFADWQALGLPVVVPEPAADRYSRQMLLAHVGLSGQERLSRAKVLLIGLAGLGSPAAL